MHEIAEKGVPPLVNKERRQKIRYSTAALAQVDLHASADAFWSLSSIRLKFSCYPAEALVLPIGSCPVILRSCALSGRIHSGTRATPDGAARTRPLKTLDKG
jgi:hypothetical protein